MLEILTVDRFQNRICISSFFTSASQDKQNNILYIAMNKCEQLQLTHDDSKSEEGQGNH